MVRNPQIYYYNNILVIIVLNGSESIKSIILCHVNIKEFGIHSYATKFCFSETILVECLLL